MKVWLDDVREAPDGWVHVKTPEKAIELLRTEGWMRSRSITTLASPHPNPSGRVTPFWRAWRKQSLPEHGSIRYPRCTSTPRILGVAAHGAGHQVHPAAG
jgi:hypothetical protein